MPSTYTCLHYHIIFSTKLREPLIKKAWSARLHEYLGGTIRGLRGVPEIVNGVNDHVHILAGLKATHCLADFMRELKKNSSTWMRSELGAHEFAWQEGYAAFTVSPTGRKGVKAYIAKQEQHHRVIGFKVELIDLLKRAGLEYDPRYLD